MKKVDEKVAVARLKKEIEEKLQEIFFMFMAYVYVKLSLKNGTFDPTKWKTLELTKEEIALDFNGQGEK